MKPTQELMAEHEAVLTALDLLKRVAGAVSEGDGRALGDLEHLLDFFRGFVDGCHHAKEEGALFPELERRGFSRDRGPVGVMLSEHERGRGHVRAMAEALSRVRGGESGAADFIRTHAQAYRDELTAHIEKENGVLFPMAVRLLSEAASARLAERFEAIERERGGKHEAYHALLRELRDTYAAARSPAA